MTEAQKKVAHIPSNPNRWASAKLWERKRVQTELTLDGEFKSRAIAYAKKLGKSLSQFAEESMQSAMTRSGEIPRRKRTK